MANVTFSSPRLRKDVTVYAVAGAFLVGADLRLAGDLLGVLPGLGPVAADAVKRVVAEVVAAVPEGRARIATTTTLTGDLDI